MKRHHNNLQSVLWTTVARILRTDIAILLVILSVSSKTAQAEVIKYKVEPVDLSNGYAISGGFIETNGAIGELSAEDVTNYEVSITGAFPFVFSPNNTNASVYIRGNVYSSTDGISVGVDPSTSIADTPSLSLKATDGSIHYSVGWANWFPPDFMFFTPEGSVITYEAVDPGIIQGFYASSGRMTTPQSLFLVATVPEPSSAAVCLIVALFGLGTGRW